VSDFLSLADALEPWFDVDLKALPITLQTWVEREFQLVTWDQLSAEQRRYLAAQWDQEHDPALEAERKRSWDLVCRISDIERQIERWDLVPAPTASDLDVKERKQAELRAELAKVQALQRGGRGRAEESEDPGERRSRIRRRRDQLKAAGDRSIVKTLAAEENLSVTRIKQLLADKPAKARPAGPATWVAPVLPSARAASKKPKS
jgi:hypothetical protein